MWWHLFAGEAKTIERSLNLPLSYAYCPACAYRKQETPAFYRFESAIKTSG